MPITIIAVTGLAYWGRFDQYVFLLLMTSSCPYLPKGTHCRYILEDGMTLPTTTSSFKPAGDRTWLVRFWQLEGKWVGVAFPFGLVLFILFYFDANVSVSVVVLLYTVLIYDTLVIDCTRCRISPEETCGIPLGLFYTWYYNFHCRITWYSCS